VGIFIVLGVVILIFGFLWIKQATLKGTGYHITVRFDNAAGLRKNDPVRIRGVDKGRVVSIALKQDWVEVECYVEGDIILKKDVDVSIKDVALISGTKYIELKVGEDEKPFDISKPIEGKGTTSFSLGELGEILEPIRKIAEKISRGDIEETLDNINVATTELAALVRENRAGIRRTVRKAEKDLDKFVSVVEKLDKNLDILSQALEDINEGKGTVGKLMKDEELYNEIEKTLEETKALIKDFKENPKKYINIRVF
jgi:phospholipid/cholesterol/gamma-HCH transport system substrate-binding protein